MRIFIGIVIIVADIFFTFLMYSTSKKDTSDWFFDSFDILPITITLLLFALVLITLK
jgi:hypothetical protein